MYGLYGLKHHKVEMSPWRDGQTTTWKDRATQLLISEKLSLAIILSFFMISPLKINHLIQFLAHYYQGGETQEVGVSGDRPPADHNKGSCLSTPTSFFCFKALKNLHQSGKLGNLRPLATSSLVHVGPQ